MENHINLFQPANHYLQHFYIALTNFEQLAEEDRHRKVSRARRIKQRKFGLNINRRQVQRDDHRGSSINAF